MSFEGIQKTVDFTQINTGNIKEVFSLLCPTRERLWLDGWQYKMIQSKSGHIEKDCVFSTKYENEVETIWMVTQYDKENYKIEFVRVTPGELVVKININLNPIGDSITETHISYTYTGLNIKQNEYIKTKLEKDFFASMNWWEKAMNHYLTTGTTLIKGSL